MGISDWDIIYYASPLGILEIKSSVEAVHEILFVKASEEPKLNRDELVCNSNHAVVQTCTKQLDEYFAGKRRIFDFPFEQQGTPFQQKVWSALLDVPYGNTISYMELSGRIGNKKAVRAVGTTNGKNKIYIVVPCHRVIGAKGSLVGYGGELWRKKWLLEHEAKYALGVQVLGNW